MKNFFKYNLFTLLLPIGLASCAHLPGGYSTRANPDLVSSTTYEATEKCYSYVVHTVEKCNMNNKCQAYLDSTDSNVAILAEISAGSEKGNKVVICYVTRSSNGKLINSYQKK